MILAKVQDKYYKSYLALFLQRYFLIYYWRNESMWVITVYTKDNSIKMFEFDNEKEAKEFLQKQNGCKILSHVVYFNDNFVKAVS
jgi:hypothetical protein